MYQVLAEGDGGDAQAGQQGEGAVGGDEAGIAVVGVDLGAAPHRLMGSQLLEVHSVAHWSPDTHEHTISAQPRGANEATRKHVLKGSKDS